MTPTLSFLARSRSAASVLNNSKDGRKLKEINAAFIFAVTLLNVFLMKVLIPLRLSSLSPFGLSQSADFVHPPAPPPLFWPLESDVQHPGHHPAAAQAELYTCKFQYLSQWCAQSFFTLSVILTWLFFNFMAFNRCLWKCPSKSQKFDIRFILFSHKDG